MRKKYTELLVSLLIVCLIPIFSSCGMLGNHNDKGQAENTTEEKTEEEQIMGQFQDEDESIELHTQSVDDSFFVGTWKAETDRAVYMYGNVTITIKEDGTWVGNITDEDVHGTWRHKGDGIILESDIIPFNMVFSDNNNVLLQETDDAVRVVLTRQ